MKTRLPKTLLLAVLAAMSVSTVYANTDPNVMTPFDIIEVSSATTADGNILNRLQVESKDGYAAIVKDGQGTMTIESNATVKNTFIVREGETIVTGGATINSTQSGDSMLMVGGLNAKLKLDNATYQTTDAADQTTGATVHNDSIVIGGRDGNGALHLTNGAVLKNHHCLFVGGQSRSGEWKNTTSTFQHVCGSYADSDKEVLYRDSHKDDNGNTIYPNFNDESNYRWQNNNESFNRYQSKGTVTVDLGSKLYVGYGMNFCNADIKLTGEDTELIEGYHKVVGNDYYISRWGDAVYGGTTVTITDYATLTANNDLFISSYGGADAPEVNGGFNGDTVVTIGTGGTLNSLRYTYIGEKSYMAKTTFTVQDGGTANITHATLGISTAGTVTGTASATPTAVLNIDEGGTYTGSSMTLAEDSVVTNKGSIALADGTMVLASENGVATASQSVDAALAINDGGKLVNSGSITVAGALTMSGGAELVFDLTALDMDNLPSLTVEKLSMTDGAIISLIFGSEAELQKALGIAAVMDALETESVDSTILHKLVTFTTEDGLAGADDIKLTLSYYDADSSEFVTYEGTGAGDVTLSDVANAVPEPTTATLSLLALAGLCARRRRASL